MAAIAALVLLGFLAVLIAIGVRGAASQRRYVGSRLDGARALYLAESGANEALAKLVGSAASGDFERTGDGETLVVSWRPAAQPNEVEIVATARTGGNALVSQERTVRLRCVSGASGARVASWREGP